MGLLRVGALLLYTCAAVFLIPLVGVEAEEIGSSLCRVQHPSDANVVWSCRRIGTGESLESLFGGRWQDVGRFNRVDRRHAAPGVSIKVPKELESIRELTPMPREYPSALEDTQFMLIDIEEQFLGAYERGVLQFSMPITAGKDVHPTPIGTFRVTAAHRRHPSTRYSIEGTEIPYPMTYALRFHVDQDGVGFWIHGRDLPGKPISHGCVGLYDEAMQQQYYGVPREPVLNDAKRLYEWVLKGVEDRGGIIELPQGPRVRIVRGLAADRTDQYSGSSAASEDRFLPCAR